MASPWAPAPHPVDHAGYVVDAYAEPASPGAQPSSPGRRALAWFSGKGSKAASRSRSRDNDARSRSASPRTDGRTPSPTFVVRNVTRQPGGVSLDAQSPQLADYQQQQPEGAQLQYSRSRSRPVGGVSLGVPPGGRGGGTGYGTATSSNDGRPEGIERGRTGSAERDASHQQQQRSSPSRTGSGNAGGIVRPASPGAMTAGAFRNSGRISPGPMSWAQQQAVAEQARFQSGGGGPREMRQPGDRSPARSPAGPRTAPGGFSSSPSRSPLSSSPLAPHVSAVHAGGSSAAQQQPPQHYAVPRSIDMRNGPPPVIPLDGMPSPISIPRPLDSPGRSPLGTPSPGRSPDGRAQNAGGNSPGIGGGAGRWMNKLFSRSPRAASPADDTYAGWGRQPSPALAAADDGTGPTPYGIPAGVWGASKRAQPTDDEREAALLRERSQREAARIVDAERRAIMERPTPAAYDPNTDRPFVPRQAVDDQDGADEDVGLVRETRSPPGRKPVPRFHETPDVEELRRMSLTTRESVAQQLDPHDALSRLEGRLTPAQQIIAETRSRHLARERAEAAAAEGSSVPTQVQRGFQVGEHIKDASSRAPTVPAKSPVPSQRQPSEAAAPEVIETPMRRKSTKRVAAPPAAAPETGDSPQRRAAPKPAAGGAGKGLQPGDGPLPMDMSLPAALQEMMIRFYRFERYSVPLIRSLETRLLDIERDAQLAINGDAQSANSARDREMDRWVGQMTSLMRHEVGQLKAATHEIREGRELLGQVVKNGAGGPPGSGFRPRVFSGADSSAQASPSSTRAETGQVKAPPLSPLKTKNWEEDDRVPELGSARSPITAEHAGHAARTNNISSASFQSAVPRVDPRLGLPAGAAPALDKDEGKSAHGKTASSSSGARRERSTSPGGRPRFTSALGEPMQSGRISPLERRSASDDAPLEPPAPGRFAAPGAAAAAAGARVSAVSPAPSDTASNASGSVSARSSKRGQSVDERLKALVADRQMRTPSLQSQSSIVETLEGDESTDATSMTSTRLGNDYPLQEAKEAESRPTPTPSRVLAAPTRSHTQQPSDSSQATFVPTGAARRSTLMAPVDPAPYLGGRTSPTPSSHSAHSPNARRSVSPANLVPGASANIKTAPHASQGLRARAQSYLQNADSSGTAAATESPPSSPIPAASWISSRSGVSPSKLAETTTASTSRSASPDELRLKSSSGALSRPASQYGLQSSASTSKPGSPTKTEPLSIKKSAGSLRARSVNTTPGAGSAISSVAPASPGAGARKGAPPVGKSLRERAAFFESAA